MYPTVGIEEEEEEFDRLRPANKDNWLWQSLSNPTGIC